MHIGDNNKIFACCDKDLINKELKFNDASIKISENFYGSEEITIKNFLENINECTQANIFGKKACSILLDNKLILKEQIIDVSGTPHVQIYKI